MATFLKSTLFVLALAVLVPSTTGLAQGPAGRGGANRAPAAPGPWFNVPLPPPFGHAPAVMVGVRPPRPVVLPPGEPAAPEFVGTTIRADLDAIVGFAKESRTTKEIGSGQIWGRITGFPSSTKTVKWAADQFRKAGIADVKLQPITQEANASFWLPLSWEVRLLARSRRSGPAAPMWCSNRPCRSSPSEVAVGHDDGAARLRRRGESGRARAHRRQGQDCRAATCRRATWCSSADRRVARAGSDEARGGRRVQHHAATRQRARAGLQQLRRSVLQPRRPRRLLPRERARPASQRRRAGKLRAQINLKTETRSNLKAENGVAVIPGRRTRRNHHRQRAYRRWFDGAGDNADGLAVLIALASHFAKPENRPERTLVFIASAGHHSPGLNGPRNFIAMNADLAKKAIMMLNLEHVAQRNFSPSTRRRRRRLPRGDCGLGRGAHRAGCDQRSPFVHGLLHQGVARYGVNFVSTRRKWQAARPAALHR